jgi:predicted nuclease with TOPRIM domain
MKNNEYWTLDERTQMLEKQNTLEERRAALMEKIEDAKKALENLREEYALIEKTMDAFQDIYSFDVNIEYNDDKPHRVWTLWK